MEIKTIYMGNKAKIFIQIKIKTIIVNKEIINSITIIIIPVITIKTKIIIINNSKYITIKINKMALSPSFQHTWDVYLYHPKLWKHFHRV